MLYFDFWKVAMNFSFFSKKSFYKGDADHNMWAIVIVCLPSCPSSVCFVYMCMYLHPQLVSIYNVLSLTSV